MTEHNSEQIFEARRRYYLQAMDVDLYFPRRELANALPSNLVEPLLVEIGKESPSSKPIEQRDAKPKPEIPRPADKELSVEQPSTSETKLRFQLRAWPVARDLLVVDTRGREVALPVDTLLRNMLAALGYRDPLAKPDTLRWPITGASNNLADARAMVSAFIEARQQRFGFGTVLLMGEQAAAMALGRDAPERWQRQTIKPDLEGITLPSLSELLQNPALKKNTWHSIRHLRLPT